MEKRGQVSVEYLIIVGFVTFLIIGILGIALVYSTSIEDRIKNIQMNNFANKVISTSESVFYAGEPSKLTLEVYLPEDIKNVTIQENNLFIVVGTSTGTNILSFGSNVPISGDLSYSTGLKKIELVASSGEVVISQV